MAEQRGLNARVRPLAKHGNAVNSAMQAHSDLDIAYQVQRTAFHEKRTVKSFYFFGDWEAPISYQKTSVNTLLPFSYWPEDEPMEIGWLAHPNATKLKAVVQVAVGNFDLELNLALQTRTLIDSITTKNGDLEPIPPPQKMPRLGFWGREMINVNTQPFSFATCPIIVEPAYPADRTKPIAVRINAYWKGEANPTNLSVERTAGIVALRMFDIIEGPEAEA